MRGLCLAIACFFSPLWAEGQANIRLGGGPGMPIGDLADGLETVGPSFLAGLAIPVDIGYFLLIEGHHSRFGIDEEAMLDPNEGVKSDAATKLTGGNVGLLIEGVADPVGFYGHGGVGWTRGTRSTGRDGRSVEGVDARNGTDDHSFTFVIGLGVNVSISDNLGLTVNVRYNHARDIFHDRAQWTPVTVSAVIRL